MCPGHNARMKDQIRFKRFTRPNILQRLGRPLLERFLQQFKPGFDAANVPLPDPGLPDAIYFGSLARLLATPENLPDSLTEALFAVDEMASAQGVEDLQAAAAAAGLPLAFEPTSSREDIALQVWLAEPTLLARKHNEKRLLRLTAFEHFGAQDAAAPGPGPAKLKFDAPVLAALTAALDPWFARHLRGRNTTRVELYPLRNEFWFLVRHGDTFSRTPKVEEQQTQIIHFRPERDDVVVYSPRYDEIRINARTRGERDLYVETFGRCLRGRADYFSDSATYTLEPLRAEGPDALHTSDIPGIARITLRAIEVAWGNSLNETTIREADDLFKCTSADGAAPVPKLGRLTRAAFDFFFEGTQKPRPVQIRPPNILKLGRHCDIQLVETWLSRRGFRRKEGGVRADVMREPQCET